MFIGSSRHVSGNICEGVARAFRLSFLAFTLAAAGCGGGRGSLTGAAGSSGGAVGAGGRGGSGAAGMGGSGAAGAEGRVVLHDANNYTAIASLTIPVVQTAPGADLTICWNALVKDLFCHDLVTSDDIDNVALLQMTNASRDQIAAALAVGALEQSTVSGYVDYHVDQSPTSTCAKLSQFAFVGTHLVPAADYVADANKTYLLLFATGTTPGVGSRSMLFLEPTSASSVAAVDAVDACAANVLDFQATLGQPLPISRTDSTQWHLDWSLLTRDSFNNAVNFARLDGVQIGFYQNLTAADLQARFIDIELIATLLYEVPIAAGARDVDLVDARLRGTSEPFPGFIRADGVWAVIVRCSRCQATVPVVLTILQPQ
jgi:hypothetical protein